MSNANHLVLAVNSIIPMERMSFCFRPLLLKIFQKGMKYIAASIDQLPHDPLLGFTYPKSITNSIFMVINNICAMVIVMIIVAGSCIVCLIMLT